MYGDPVEKGTVWRYSYLAMQLVSLTSHVVMNDSAVFIDECIRRIRRNLRGAWLVLITTIL